MSHRGGGGSWSSRQTGLHANARCARGVFLTRLRADSTCILPCCQGKAWQKTMAVEGCERPGGASAPEELAYTVPFSCKLISGGPERGPCCTKEVGQRSSSSVAMVDPSHTDAEGLFRPDVLLYSAHSSFRSATSLGGVYVRIIEASFESHGATVSRDRWSHELYTLDTFLLELFPPKVRLGG